MFSSPDSHFKLFIAWSVVQKQPFYIMGPSGHDRHVRLQSSGVCIFSNRTAVESSVHDYLLFTHQCWINTDDLTQVCAYTSMCIYLLLHRMLGPDTQHFLDPDWVCQSVHICSCCEGNQRTVGVIWPWPGCVKPLGVVFIEEQKGRQSRVEVDQLKDRQKFEWKDKKWRSQVVLCWPKFLERMTFWDC